MNQELKFKRNYYEGFEGEPEFIFSIFSGNQIIFTESVWDGYFSLLFDSFNLPLPTSLQNWFHNLDVFWDSDTKHEWSVDAEELLFALEDSKWENLEEYRVNLDAWINVVSDLKIDLLQLSHIAMTEGFQIRLFRD